jgi:signal transduction histidine kinase
MGSGHHRLAVVRDRVQAYGGTVAGSSAGKNQGSAFVVTLPKA